VETTRNPSATLRQRGRKSAASRLALIPDLKLRRPQPRHGLTEAERAVWAELTEAVRPDCEPTRYNAELGSWRRSD
jgi:hypothetical protein